MNTKIFRLWIVSVVSEPTSTVGGQDIKNQTNLLVNYPVLLVITYTIGVGTAFPRHVLDCMKGLTQAFHWQIAVRSKPYRYIKFS